MSIATPELDPIVYLRDLVAIPSPTNSEAAITDHIAEVWRSMGRFSMVEVTPRGNVVGVIPGHDRSAALVLGGHSDTVPATDSWTYDPYTLTPDPIDPDRFHGLGATDMKSGLAVMCAIAAKTEEEKPPTDLVLVVSPDEEDTQTGAIELVDWIRQKELLAQYGERIGGILLEPTNADRFFTGHRGDTVWNVTARDAVHAASGHASRDLRHTDDPTTRISRLVVAAKDALSHSWAADYASDTLGVPTINPTGIGNNSTAPNVIADTARCTLNVRATVELADALPEIRAQIERDHGVTIDQSWEPRPAQCPTDARILRAARLVLPGSETGAFVGATDYAYLQKVVKSMIIYGPGALDQMHVADEWVRKSAIRACQANVERMIGAFAAAA